MPSLHLDRSLLEQPIARMTDADTRTSADLPSENGQGRGARIRMLLGLALLAGLVVLAVRSIDLAAFENALVHADLRLAGLAALVSVTVCMGASSARLWVLMRPLPSEGPPVGFWPLTSIYLASSAAHHLLPAPAAEVARTLYLKKRYGYTIGALLAAQLVEKVIDGLGLGLEVLALALFASLPRILDRTLLAAGSLAAVGVLGFLGFAWWWGRKHRDEPPSGRISAFLHRTFEAMFLLRKPKLWAVALGFSMVNDLANAATFGLASVACGIHLSLASWFILLLVARFAGVLPSTPGQFGVIEAGLVLALSAFGVDHARALAVAVIYHLAHFVPVTTVGLFELRRQWQTS
jgi:uncharacterized protein (TIRG00374 family)